MTGFPMSQTVVFLIRTFVADIKTLAKEQRNTLAEVINKMNDEEISYKGLDKDKIISYISL